MIEATKMAMIMETDRSGYLNAFQRNHWDG
jgi:hypothetical protein